MKIVFLIGAIALGLAGMTACSADNDVASGEPTVSTAESPTPSQANQLALGDLWEVAEAIADGTITSEEMVEAYLRRIDEIDRAGPTVNAVLTLNPNALADARKADAARAAGAQLGALHGVPILLKDNIESLDPIATTAGSYALKDNVVDRDAPMTAGLRAAGAVILGKTNLSQWANFRSSDSVSGWSAIGGVVRNPHMLSRSACGSSSGSGAAAAAALAAGTVGTETNGSIICPSSSNGVVGFKPTVGLVSQQGIVPISSSQDTAGPMTRSVRDAAMMLTAMATGEGRQDFAAALDDRYLDGRRVGVMRFAIGSNADVAALFDDALAALEAQGAILVDVESFARPEGYRDASRLLTQAEFKHTLNAYLATTDPAEVSVRTLEDLIAFNRNAPEEALFLFDQARMIGAQARPGLDDPGYKAAVELVQRATRSEGIDKMLIEHNVDILVSPSRGPAFIIDAIYGDQSPGGIGAGYIAAVSGYPNMTVPMGTVHGLPIGIDFMSGKGRDADVLAAGYDYEQATHKIVAPEFHRSALDIEEVGEVMKPR